MDKTLSIYGGHGWLEDPGPSDPTPLAFYVAPMIQEFGLKNVEFLITGLINTKNHAPKVAWYLVTEALHPIGKTYALGY